MIGYLAAGFVGFLLGVVLTTVLLCKQNLETYKQIESNANMKNSFEAAKSLYRAQVEAYENGEDFLADESADDSSVDESEE